MYIHTNEIFGYVYSFTNYNGNGRISFDTKGSGYCGWDVDHHRFRCSGRKSKSPATKGTSLYELWGQKMSKWDLHKQYKKHIF